MATRLRIAKLNERFAGKFIMIRGNHERAGHTCHFVEMVESDQHVSGILMKVVFLDGTAGFLKPENVSFVSPEQPYNGV